MPSVAELQGSLVRLQKGLTENDDDISLLVKTTIDKRKC